MFDDPELGRRAELRTRLSHELRMFGSIARAQIRDRVSDFQQRLASLEAEAEDRAILVEDIRVSCQRFLDELGELIEAWRALRAPFHDGSVPRPLRESYQYVDEFLSLNVEARLSALVSEIDGCDAYATSLAELRAALRRRIVAERRYRTGAGYILGSGPDPADDDNFVYHNGKLKKFVHSVLWLEITKEKEGRRLSNVGAAIAAGVAMAFAALATIQAHTWAINTSEFVVAAVITYMLKDRIKDWLKHFFARRLTRFLFDYNVRIRDPVSGESIGRCREAMSYVKISDVPADVMRARRGDATVLIDAEAKPEVVIRYEKEIRLDGEAAIDRLHSRHFDINDIIRFSLADFLQRADDPVSVVPMLDEERDLVVDVPFRKLYHLNLVMVFRSSSLADDVVIKRVRVVFDKDAIQRLDEVA